MFNNDSLGDETVGGNDKQSGEENPMDKLRRERHQLGVWAAQLASTRPNTTTQQQVIIKKPPFVLNKSLLSPSNNRSHQSRFDQTTTTVHNNNNTEQDSANSSARSSASSGGSGGSGGGVVLRSLHHPSCGEFGDKQSSFSTELLVLEMDNQRLRKRVEVLSNKLVYVQQQQEQDAAVAVQQQQQDQDAAVAAKREDDNSASRKMLAILEQQNSALEHELTSNKQETKQLLLQATSLQNNIKKYEHRSREANALVDGLQNKIVACATDLSEQTEKVKILEAALSAADTGRSGEMESRKHYEGMLTELQNRYAQLAQHVQELEEKRSSFADGLREKSTQLDNVSALLQMAREETTRMAAERDCLDRKQREFGWELQHSRDELNSLSKNNQQIREENNCLQNQLTSTTDELNTTTTQLDNTTTTLNETTTALQQTTEALHHTQEILQQLEQQTTTTPLVAPEEEEEQQQQQEQQQALNCAAELSSTTITPCIGRTDWQVDNNNSILPEQTGAESIEMATAALVNERVEEAKKVLQRQHSKHLSVIDADNQSRLEELQRKHEGDLRKWSNRADSLKAHVTRNRNALGWLPASRSPSDLKGVFRGAVATKVCYRGNKHKRVDRFIKVTADGTFAWSADLTGNGQFDSQKAVPLESIFRTEYGPYSQAQLWTNSQHKEVPWRCFSLFTANRSFDFITKDDKTAESFVIGLGRLIGAHSSSPMIQSRSEFLIRRSNLKLSAYCVRRGISQRTLWVEAIRRTLAQQPDIIMRHRGEPVTPKRPPKKRTPNNNNYKV
eukprot:GHVS01042210.1.p1 GENE.GHVS01042210.1~~GHVS01042210.1.p1  ORF type:complete len:789 (-),score=210.22 GHVS01042210.1:283-2649(-)